MSMPIEFFIRQYTLTRKKNFKLDYLEKVLVNKSKLNYKTGF
jgi:hypothetical protein